MGTVSSIECATGAIALTQLFSNRLADGVWTDEDIPHPLARMTDLLNKTTNRALVYHWGVWLTGKDAELGLKVCALSRNTLWSLC